MNTGCFSVLPFWYYKFILGFYSSLNALLGENYRFACTAANHTERPRLHLPWFLNDIILQGDISTWLLGYGPWCHIMCWALIINLPFEMIKPQVGQLRWHCTGFWAGCLVGWVMSSRHWQVTESWVPWGDPSSCTMTTLTMDNEHFCISFQLRVS
jgi:hypothetical protein